MNILYLIPQLYNSGGMERVLCQKANWLVEHGHTITIATTECTPEDTRVSFFELDPRIHVEQLNIDFDADFAAPLPKKWLRHQQKKRRYKRALQALILQGHYDLCISLCGKEIAFLSELPCLSIAELHFSKDERKQRILAFHKGPLWRLLGDIRVATMVADIRKINRLVVLTQADYQQWQQAGVQHISVIPNPCSLDGLTLPSPSREKEVLAVGRLHPQKGYDLLLQAWKAVENQHADWRLTIVGDGPEKPHLLALAHQLQLQNVRFEGAQQQVETYYTRASILALSSRYEGLPLAMIEGMWCGLPCVCFDCPHGPAELLQEGGGILVENGQIGAFSQALITLIQDDDRRSREGDLARRFAQSHYAIQTIMEQWEKLLHTQ